MHHDCDDDQIDHDCNDDQMHHDCRGGTQNLAQTRKGKKTPGKEKRLPARILTKERNIFCDKIMRKSVGKYPIQKCVNVCRDKGRQKMRNSVGKSPIQKC